MFLPLVIEDEVGPLGVTALVRTKHDVVLSWVTESLAILELGADFDVTTTTHLVVEVHRVQHVRKLIPLSHLVEIHLPFHLNTVQVGNAKIILFVSKIGLLEDVLALVIEDEVGPLGVTALDRTKHDVELSWVNESLAILELGADFDLTTTTHLVVEVHLLTSMGNLVSIH